MNKKISLLILLLTSFINSKADSLSDKIDSFFKPLVSDYLVPVIFWDPLKFFGFDIGADIPIVVLWLVFGALFFTFRMKFINFRGFKHALSLVRGDYDDPEDKGEVSHFQALTTALSATVGLGNIAGVAIAISVGGPGATFWMIVAGLLGMSSKFVECTLGVKYRKLDANGEEIFITSNLLYFLNDDFLEDLNRGQKRIIEQFAQLDDYDIYFCLKKWQNNSDKILSLLSKNLLNRNINKIIIETKKIDSEKIINIKNKVSQEFQLNNSEVEFLVINDQVSNHVYNEDNSNINILMKNNEIVDLAEASDHFNIKALNNKTKKYFISYPKLTS